MNQIDISSHFSEFKPTAQQLRAIEKAMKKGNKWWGTDYAEIETQNVALMLAPGELANLTPAAYDLLKRCQNRKWAFYRWSNNVRQHNYGYPYKGTYGELAELLLSLDLIYEANSRQKLAGNSTVKELRELLQNRGLETRGKKDELVDRIMNNLSEPEIKNLTSGVFLYIATEKGENTLDILQEHIAKVISAFSEAVRKFNSALVIDRDAPPVSPPEELSDIISQEAWDSLAEGGRLEVTQELNITSHQKIDRGEKVSLSKKAIQSIIDNISAHQDGFLTIAITTDENSPFVQTCYNREGTYFIDSNGDLETLRKLGFRKSKDDFLPCKYVPENKVVIALLNTLQEAFGVELGRTVEFNYEYIKQENE